LESKWLWITIAGMILVTLIPWYAIYVILLLPSPINAIVVWSLIIGWGVAAGYKDWQLYKKKEEKWVPGQERERPRDYPT